MENSSVIATQPVWFSHASSAVVLVGVALLIVGMCLLPWFVKKNQSKQALPIITGSVVMVGIGLLCNSLNTKGWYTATEIIIIVVCPVFILLTILVATLHSYFVDTKVEKGETK